MYVTKDKIINEMVLIGAKTMNQCRIPIRMSNNPTDIQSTRMVPNFSITTFVPVKSNISSYIGPALKEDKQFTMATLKRPKVMQ